MTCRRCSGATVMLFADEPDRWFGSPGTWDVRRCLMDDCGIFQLDPEPNDQQLSAAYSVYYTHEDQGLDLRGSFRRIVRALQDARLAEKYGYATSPPTPRRSVQSAIIRLWAGRALDVDARVMMLDRPRPGARLLDIGCGSGAFLARMNSLGWIAEGTEIDSTAAGLAAKSGTVHLGDVMSLNLEASTYDAICMSHVIEHVRDPVAVLAECRKLLRPGGELIAVTPNANSWLSLKFGHRWRGLEVPRHLRVYTEAALEGDALCAGFADVKVAASAHAANTMYLLSASMARPVSSGVAHQGRRILSELVQQAEAISGVLGGRRGEELWLRAIA